jgi:hypothetical protein
MPDDANVIHDIAALRDIIGHPSEMAQAKSIRRLDRHCRQFIGLSPFLCLATADAAGKADVSPRGDQPGFVQVLDDETLLIPERPGNARIDSLSNVIANPNIGLIFFIPGFEDTLRVNGKARVTADPALLAGCAVEGKLPKVALLVSVEETFLHCAKAFKRSRLWSPEAQVARSDMPSLARIIMEQVADARQQQRPAEAEMAQVDAAIEEEYRTELY